MQLAYHDPKCNSLHKNTSYDVKIVKIGPTVFAQLIAYRFTHPQNLALYNAFESLRVSDSKALSGSGSGMHP